MKKIIVIILLGLITHLAYSQDIHLSFNNVSLSEALKKINQSFPSAQVQFIYDELEDFHVQKNIECRNALDAIREVCGSYPIKITSKGKNIFVECTLEGSTKMVGRVIDENGESLEYASVALLSVKDSAFIGGAVTNSNGDFVIPCAEEKADVRVSYIGYGTIRDEHETGNIGTIQMKTEDVNLQPVRVSGMRPLSTIGSDRIVFDMSPLQGDMPSDDAYGLLTRLPYVVENDGNFMVGNQAATLIINGKIMTMSQEQTKKILKNMSAESLESAEIMLSAPSRYHVRGTVINIVTKANNGGKNFSGQVSTSLLRDKKNSGIISTTAQYTSNKFAIEGMVSWTRGKRYYRLDENSSFGSTANSLFYIDKYVTNGNDLLLKLEGEYAFAQNHRIGLTFYNDIVNDKSTDQTIIGWDYLYPLHSLGNCRTKYNLKNTILHYSTPFGLSFNASYLKYKSPERAMKDSYSLSNTPSQISTFNENISCNQNIDNWTFTLDQCHKVDNIGTIEYGIKFQYAKDKLNDFQYTTPKDPKDEEFFYLGNIYGKQLTERITSGYLSFTTKPGSKVSATIGIEAEYYNPSRTIASYPTPQSQSDPDRWMENLESKFFFLPNLNLTWKANEKNTIHISLGGNASYPAYWQLLGSYFFTTSRTAVYSYPVITPSHDYQFSVLWRLKNNFSVNLFSNLSKDHIVDVPAFIYSLSDYRIMFMNVDSYNTLGMTASGRFNIGKVINGNINATIMNSHWKNDNLIKFDKKQLSAVFASTVSANLVPNHNIRLIVRPRYQTKSIKTTWEIDPLFNLDASLRYMSPNGIWSASLSCDNITNSSKNFSYSESGHPALESYDDLYPIMDECNYNLKSWQNWRRYSLTLICKFGGFKENKTKEVDTDRIKRIRYF